MRISDVIGLFAALIGSTAVLLAAWEYIHSKRPAKRELLGALLTIMIILACILGLAVAISQAPIRINGQQTIPVPGFPPADTPVPASTPRSPPLSSPTSVATSTPLPTATSSPSPTSTPTALPSPSPTSLPSPTTNPTP